MLCALSLVVALGAVPADEATGPAPAVPADAPSAPAATGPADAPGRGVFTSDAYRYGRHGLVPGLALRTLLDVVAIPSGVVGWSAFDFTEAGVVVASTVTLSLPLGPSPDVRLQRALRGALGENTILWWTPARDVALWASLWAGVASVFLVGLIGSRPAEVEAATLAVEAFLIGQLYSNLIKLFTGRAGPKDGLVPGMLSSDGAYGGPPGFFRYWPSGTPSGHVVTAYAILTALSTYYAQTWLTVALQAVGAFIAVTVFTDNYHFLSESILGAAIGFGIGRWVVHHRSTRYRNGADGLPRRLGDDGVLDAVTLVPVVVPGGGLGLGLSAAW